MNENERNERIVREFLRKIAPPREWEYLGEVEHYWISQLCDELNKQLKAENAELREFAKNAYRHICTQEGYLRGSGYDSFDYYDTVARKLGIEVQ